MMHTNAKTFSLCCYVYFAKSVSFTFYNIVLVYNSVFIGLLIFADNVL